MSDKIVNSHVYTSKNRKYIYLEHSGSSQVFTNTNAKQVFINGKGFTLDGGLIELWNTESSVFTPPPIKNQIYTILVDGVISPPGGGNPTFHLDFVYSGSHSEFGIGHQGSEIYIRNAGDDQHIHSTFTVIVTQDLINSGGIFQANSSGNDVTLVNASILIKED